MNKILEKLNKIPIWQKLVFLLVLSAIIPAYFQVSVWEPIEAKVKKLQLDYQDLDRKFREQKVVADDLVTFQQNTKKLEEDLKVALTQLPREKELPTLLRDIYTLGKKSGVSFRSFSPGNELPKSLYSEFPIKLQITGSFHEVAVFFDRISKLSRIVNISDLSMGSGKSDGDEILLNVDCTATTFMFQGAR